MNRRIDLPEEIVECLEHYRDGRCPELAACLLEELVVHSRCAESDTERCLCHLLLRNRGGVDRTRRDLPAPRPAPMTSEPDARTGAPSRHLVKRRSLLARMTVVTTAPPVDSAAGRAAVSTAISAAAPVAAPRGTRTAARSLRLVKNAFTRGGGS